MEKMTFVHTFELSGKNGLFSIGNIIQDALNKQFPQLKELKDYVIDVKIDTLEYLSKDNQYYSISNIVSIKTHKAFSYEQKQIIGTKFEKSWDKEDFSALVIIDKANNCKRNTFISVCGDLSKINKYKVSCSISVQKVINFNTNIIQTKLNVDEHKKTPTTILFNIEDVIKKQLLNYPDFQKNNFSIYLKVDETKFEYGEMECTIKNQESFFIPNYSMFNNTIDIIPNGDENVKAKLKFLSKYVFALDIFRSKITKKYFSKKAKHKPKIKLLCEIKLVENDD